MSVSALPYLPCLRGRRDWSILCQRPAAFPTCVPVLAGVFRVSAVRKTQEYFIVTVSAAAYFPVLCVSVAEEIATFCVYALQKK